MVTFSTPISVSWAASSLTAPVVASTFQTLLTRRRSRGVRTHTLPNALATSTAHTRSMTKLVLGVGNLLRHQRLFPFQFACPPIELTHPGSGLPGGLGQSEPKF